MIQILPNELQIEILNYVIIETKTICKKWNSFVPLVMHKAVISVLNSGLKLELTYWNDTKQIKKLLPTYDDYTKTFTFLFDNPENDFSKPLNDHKVSFIAFVERNENNPLNNPFPIKLGVELGDLTFPEFINNDIYKYDFDHRSNIRFKREIKNNEEGESISCVKLYSFTIEAWKLCYILDSLNCDTEASFLKDGFKYKDCGYDWWNEYGMIRFSM
ncbi:17656_t:CDS:2 [Dentiscutata erythropus]|uniref:17656_t:CDS:1 n=1 Tax=Dentiscutata erythropus TaxID=1348616 RepID=A0A9N9IP96_9GLOM|nr:17656_t:CDS:2 [Dentiscutata erythropus]